MLGGVFGGVGVGVRVKTGGVSVCTKFGSVGVLARFGGVSITLVTSVGLIDSSEDSGNGTLIWLKRYQSCYTDTISWSSSSWYTSSKIYILTGCSKQLVLTAIPKV